ncbi:MAG: 30S ribosome-binding factor RbfA [Pirellulaceae bacterium]
MASRRMLKAAEAIREVVSMAILTELRDPRVENVTVTGVEVAPDMKTATVQVSIMGDEGRQELCLRGLHNSAGFLQSKVAKRIETRYTPRLSFEIDEGVKKSVEVARILQQIAEEREQREAEQNDAQPAGDDSPTTEATDHEHSSSDETS